MEKADAEPVSLTLPLREQPYDSNILHPFFDGLIPEGWLLNVALVNPQDKEEMALTLNGKKSNIKLCDFEAAAEHANLPEHFIRRTVERFASCLPKWEETIDRSFITQEQKEAYKSLLRDRLKRLLRS